MWNPFWVTDTYGYVEAVGGGGRAVDDLGVLVVRIRREGNEAELRVADGGGGPGVDERVPLLDPRARRGVEAVAVLLLRSRPVSSAAHGNVV